MSDVIERDASVIWPTMKSQVHAEQRSLAFSEQLHALVLFAWLHRDLLIKQLDELITDESDDGAALSHEKRQRREAETMSPARHRKARSCACVARSERRFAGRASRRHQPARIAWLAVDHDTAWRDRRNDAGIFVADAAMTIALPGTRVRRHAGRGIRWRRCPWLLRPTDRDGKPPFGFQPSRQGQGAC